jgi:hypothetical protein
MERARTEVTEVTEGLRSVERRCGPKGMPRRGHRTQPRVSTLGPTTPERRALKGRQIESTKNAKIGSSCRTSQSRTLILRNDGCVFIRYPLAPSGRTIHLWGFPGLKPWAESHSPFGACPSGLRMADAKRMRGISERKLMNS